MNPFPRSPPKLRYPKILFHQLLEEAADRDADAVALLFEEDRFTFGDLDRRSNALARSLRDHGVGPGTRVALYAKNRPEWVLSLFAISKLGASAVLLSSAWRAGELEHAFSLTDPRFIVVDADLLEFVLEASFEGEPIVLGEPVSAGIAFDDLAKTSSDTRLNLGFDPETTEVALPFSSGTTGLPKAVRHTHRSLVVAAHQWRIALSLGRRDCIQTYTPLAHILGVANVGAGIAAGARNRLFSAFDLETVLRSVERDRVTIGIAVAPVALAMSNHPTIEDFDLSSLRFFDWCATPIVSEVAKRFTRRTGIPWHTAYGCTEAPILTANPPDRPDRWRLDTAGVPGADVEMQIIDPETHESLPPGQPGEVIVRGPNLMQGYLPESANEEAFLPGRWYRTGDIGWVEPEGWLHITDRLKEMIKVSGFQVAPGEIEAVLLAHKDVVDCAVFGVADENRGHVPRAAVVLREGAAPEEEELLGVVSGRLARYKWPVAIDFVSEIPRTASGKALRRILSERAEA